MHTLVVLIAGGLRVLETQHVNRRTEGMPALARLSGVTAGRGALAGPDARFPLHLAMVLCSHSPPEQAHVHLELVDRGVARAVPRP